MQLSFSFSNNIDIYDVRNFIIHNGNRDVFDFITSSFLVNNNIYFLTGAKNSGKTYICNIWNKLKQAEFVDLKIFKYSREKYINYVEHLIALNGKYILDGIENIEIPEEFLLYLLNIITEKKAILLITSTKFVKDFSFHIPDLNSRFINIFNFILDELDEESKQKIILKLLTDKQINIDFDVLLLISKKISGNYNEILNFINKLEEIIATNKIKRITYSSIKKILDPIHK